MTKHQESMLNDPYILVRNPEGRFIFLNRYYRLLGAGTDDLSYRECLEHPGIPGDQETVRACAINFADDTEHAGDDTEHAGYVRYWIHDDSTSPRQGGKFRDDYEAKVRSILTMSEDQAK